MPADGHIQPDNVLSIQLAAGVTVSPVQPVGMDSAYQGQLADATSGSVVRCIGFPQSSGAGTKVEGSGLFTHVTLRREGKIKNANWTWTGGFPVYLGESPGTLQMHAPTASGAWKQPVAHATKSDEILLSIEVGETVP